MLVTIGAKRVIYLRLFVFIQTCLTLLLCDWKTTVGKTELKTNFIPHANCRVTLSTAFSPVKALPGS